MNQSLSTVSIFIDQISNTYNIKTDLINYNVRTKLRFIYIYIYIYMELNYIFKLTIINQNHQLIIKN